MVRPRLNSNVPTTNANALGDPVAAILAAMQQEAAANRIATKRMMKVNQDMMQAFMAEMTAMRDENRNTIGTGIGGSDGDGGNGSGAAGGNANAEVPPPVVNEDDLETRERRINAFRKHKPPSFERGYNPVEAAKWLQSLEKIFELMECQDRHKLLFATYKLEGDAHDWWRNTS